MLYSRCLAALAEYCLVVLLCIISIVVGVDEPLMVVMAEAGNSVLEETYPVEVSAYDEDQGGSLENNE